MVWWAFSFFSLLTTSIFSNRKMTPLLVPHYFTSLLLECHGPDQSARWLAPSDTELGCKYLGNEGQHEMEPWFCPIIEHGSSSFVDPDVSSVDDMEGSCRPECDDSDCWVRVMYLWKWVLPWLVPSANLCIYLNQKEFHFRQDRE